MAFVTLTVEYDDFDFGELRGRYAIRAALSGALEDLTDERYVPNVTWVWDALTEDVYDQHDPDEEVDEDSDLNT